MAREIVVTDPTGRAWVVQLERTLRMGSAHDADLLLPGLDAPLVVSPTPSAPDALLQVGDADPRLLRDGQALAVGPYQVTLRHGPTCLLAALVDAEAGDDLAGTGQEEEPGRPCPDRLLRGLARLASDPSPEVVATQGLDALVDFARGAWGAAFFPRHLRAEDDRPGPATLLCSAGLGGGPRLHAAAIATALATGRVVTRAAELHVAYLPLRAAETLPAIGVVAIGASAPLSDGELAGARSLCQVLARDLEGRATAARLRRRLGEQARLAVILDALPDGVALVRRDGDLEGLNAQATRLLSSFDQRAAGATTVIRTFSLSEPVAEAFEGRHSAPRDVTAPDGTVIEARAAPLGRSSGAVVLLRDVTDARRRDLDLREVLATVQDAVVATDEAGAIRLWNPAAERLFGYAAQEALGRSASMLLPQRYLEVFAAGATSADAASRLAGRALELVGRRKDGVELPLELTLGVASRGDRVTYTAVLRDLTERKAAQEALRRGEAQVRQACKMEAVGRLAGGIAHDFNNLLTVINGYGETLRLRVTQDPVAVRYADAIVEAGRRAAALTRQLLAFSRAQVVERTVLDLARVVADMADMLRRLLGEDVALDVRAGAGAARVLAEHGQLDQVVMNLAVNARDAMQGHGRLTIETAGVDAAAGQAHGLELAPGPWALLTVSDTGCGMDEATRARLFEPFFTTKPQGQGTGLGLSVVYGIVKQSGGHVAVESRVGQGTRFFVYLPRATGPVEPAGSSPAKGYALPGGGETVLLVEDDGAVRELVHAILDGQGYRVLHAADGAAALELLEGYRGRLDLVLTDVLMPHLGGLELSERLAAVRPDARVLFMSGCPDRVPSLAPEQFLAKPFTRASLTSAVRAVLDARGAGGKA